MENEPSDAAPSWGVPHAFHSNLPAHHVDPEDGVPYVTKFANRKARHIVELVHSIQLSEDLFVETAGSSDGTPGHVEDDEMQMDVEEDAEDEEDNPLGFPPSKATLDSVTKKCARLHSQLNSLETLKHNGISEEELCEVLLHLLRLLTCSVSFYEEKTEDDGSEGVKKLSAKLHHDPVGFLYKSQTPVECDIESIATDDELEEDLTREFALPTPAREVLLLVVISLLSNKGPLRSVSNASIYPKSADGPNRMLLILHWKSLLRMLLRTAPYLDEHRMGRTPKDSNSRQNNVVKRTVQLIRDARHFFDQGFRPPSTPGTDPTPNTDKTARQVWDMVRNDVLFHSHTHACYRGTIMLYLFQPSRCTPDYYLEVMPFWLESWTNIDRCPEFDFLWLTLFCRARKHVAPESFDWSTLRKRLLTSGQYWLSLPIGGAAMDKSFPAASNPRSRSCPPRLKVFAGSSSSYEEGIDFVAKVCKLLIAGVGTGEARSNSSGAKNEEKAMTEGTIDVLRFLNFVTPYFNPSNVGSWTFTLGAFLHYFAYELCCRVGSAAALDGLAESHPEAVAAFKDAEHGSIGNPIPAHEIVALMHALLPLCQQALYSKNGHVGRAAEAALLYLVQIDPIHSTPSLIDFASRALDVAAVNLSHQAPAALSALTRLLQPALRSDPSILLSRLPQLLGLSLAGIDSNDQNKTVRTLILYRTLTSWIPVGGKPEQWPSVDLSLDTSSQGSDGTMRLGSTLHDDLARLRLSPSYQAAVDRLPSTSLLKQGVSEEPTSPALQKLLVEEATSAMSDWALEFLERIFGLLRASGEREKTGKNASGVATRHSTADVQQARNFSRVLKECLVQVFAAMDDEVFGLALRAVVRFIEEETLPEAAKDASLLCQATAAARLPPGVSDESSCSPGLDALISVLLVDLKHQSTKTVIYRLRCLAGCVRSAGRSVLKHRAAISEAIDLAMSAKDRHVYKTGCKLLRHTLSTLSESYPIASECRPRVFHSGSSGYMFGRSAQLHGDQVQWHVPDGETIDFAWELLRNHVVKRLDGVCSTEGDSAGQKRSCLLNSPDILEVRRCLRAIRYSIRGGASLLLDEVDNDASGLDVVPYETASRRLLTAASPAAREAILAIRGRLSSFLVVLSTTIASDTFYPDMVKELPADDPYKKSLPMISADPKVCKEVCDVALLLLTRRGASFRSQEAKNLWKAQKQAAADFVLCAQVDCISEVLQSAGLYGEGNTISYKDGENAGKTLPRRLLVTRVRLFHDSLQRNASFEVPRRLRRLERDRQAKRRIVFNVMPTLIETITNVEGLLQSSEAQSLDLYEGLVDGLFALSCHSNTQVRASAVSVVDYALTRFGWLVGPRVPRLLASIGLRDEGMNGKFGLPSCSMLVKNENQQGKRKRLAEAIKGVSSILALPKAVKHVLAAEKARLAFARTMCGTDGLISLMPTEEMQKIVHYLTAVFTPFRNKFFYQPRVSSADSACHTDMISFVLDLLSERSTDKDGDESAEGKAVHWRKLLLAGWFILSTVDGRDLRDETISTRLWATCFRILEVETGQPLQRVALGILGRLVALLQDTDAVGHAQLQEKMISEPFVRALGNALVFDHREDTSVGGGHDAQWSSGVEDIIRDSSRNVAPRSLFPFQRTSQSLAAFKASHAYLVELIMSKLTVEDRAVSSKYLLSFSKEIAAAGPSEDQKNQQVTSAEIFAGLCRSFLGRDAASSQWREILLPHLEDVMGKIPFSLSGAYFDAIRYSLQFCPPGKFYALTEFLVEKIRLSLWQPSSTNGHSDNGNEEGGVSSHGMDGFTAQSKWLYLFSAVIIEMDAQEDVTTTAWYSRALKAHCEELDDGMLLDDKREKSWELVTDTLLPRLTAALGHPFDSCRDHISRCLFRICYCHRKMSRMSASRAPSRSNSLLDLEAADRNDDPGSVVVGRMLSLAESEEWTFYDRYNALGTARRFISHCVHLGEGKFEYSDYIIPLLPLAFEAIKSTVETEIDSNENNGSAEENAAKRALEAEVIKAFRYTIAEVSTTAVISYGRERDIVRALEHVEQASKHEVWQVRHASANFLRCFQGAHKFLFNEEHTRKAMKVVTDLLADDRREVSVAAMAALTGILAAASADEVAALVKRYSVIATKSKMKRLKKTTAPKISSDEPIDEEAAKNEANRSKNQRTSVFFLCATVLSHPYETPHYVPVALAAISKHSFERSAPLGIRDAVKRCCAEYKRTHMSDNWEVHRSAFSQEQLEAFEDVVSTPHYYA